jgi:hypothetical protein
MAGLVLPYLRFFFEQSNGGIREPLVQPVGRGQPHDPTSHDHDAIHFVRVLI